VTLRSLLLAAGLVVCVALALARFRAREESRALAAERALVEQQATELSRRVGVLRAETTASAVAVAERRQTTAATLPPAERARATAGPLIARLKAEQTANPRPPPPPGPPQGPTGSIFPELMGDLEYSRSMVAVERLNQAFDHRPRLEELGVAPALIEKVVELLAARAMVRWDYVSLLGDSAASMGEASRRQHAQREQIAGEIQQLLGDDVYRQFCEEVPHVTINDKTRTTTMVREIPVFRRNSGAHNMAETLQRRLSYSPEPLTNAQFVTLAAVPLRIDETSWVHPATIEQVSRVLTPAQRAAVDQLRRETEAAERRRKLPPPTPAGAK